MASVLWVAALPSPPLPRTVRSGPDAVILGASDIPDVGWGLRASGVNGTGVWRLFSVHNELVLAFLNVSLWVEADPDASARSFGLLGAAIAYP